jgi:protein O-mannosyl-transferase
MRTCFGLPLIIAFAALIYVPGLAGPFVFDDYNNIVQNRSIEAAAADIGALWQALMGGFAGPLKRPLSTLSFVFNVATTGLDPFWFKLTNVVIHLVNGLLVFALTSAALRLRNRLNDEFRDATGIALVAAAIWLVHPAQLTSVLYVVQRMTSLSATFLFAGLYVYIIARARLAEGRPALTLLWVGVPLLALLSALAKENGLLLFLYACVMEACLFNFRAARDRRPGNLAQWHLVFVALPIAAAAGWLVLHTDWSGAPSLTRPFNAIERLMTEARVLFLYLKVLALPALPELALFYDDFTISRGLLEPPATLAAVTGVLAMAVISLIARRRLPWFSFAALWFLAGHLIESTVLLLELVHIHRNYVAYFGPILAAVVGIGDLLGGRRVRLASLLAGLLVFAFGIVTAQRAHQWNDPFALSIYEVHHRPNSARANYELARLYFIADNARPNAEHRALARLHFERAMALEPYSIGAPVALLILDGGAKHRPQDPALAALLERLASRPIISKEIHFFRSLVECQASENCRRPPQEMLDVFANAVSHPALSPEMKADVLSIMGLYYANTLNDLPACIRTMKASVKAMPRDPNYRLNLAQAYIVAGRPRDAADALDEAERLDVFAAYGRRIARLRSDLAQLTQR